MGKVLFSVAKKTFIEWSQQAEAGSASALSALRELWGHGDADAVQCLLCDSRCGRPIAGLIIPSLHDPEVLVGGALCANCSGLPEQARWEAALAMLEAEDKKSLMTFH